VGLTFAVVQHTQSRGGSQKPCFQRPRGGMWASSGTGQPHLRKTCAGTVLLYSQLVTGGAVRGRRATAGPAASPSLLTPKISPKHFGGQWPGAHGSLGLTTAQLAPPGPPNPRTLPTVPGLCLGSEPAGSQPCCVPVGVSDPGCHRPPALLLLGHPGMVPVPVSAGSLPCRPLWIWACL